MGNLDESEDSEVKKEPSGESLHMESSSDLSKATSSQQLKNKDKKSSFYPQAKGLKKSIIETESSMEDSQILSVMDDKKGEETSKNESQNYKHSDPNKKSHKKLVHNHIAEFYPYEEGENEEKIINKTSLERVQTATENRRYKNKTHHAKRKSEEAVLFGPLIQKNALVHMENKISPRVNPLMKSKKDFNLEVDVKDETEYGIGYGKNPRVKALEDEDKKRRQKKKEEIKLNVTSFYDSSSSRIENIKNLEDEEASKLE